MTFKSGAANRYVYGERDVRNTHPIIPERRSLGSRLLLPIILLTFPLIAIGSDDPAEGHPRPSYDDVDDIDAMARALRESLAAQKTYSFSRAWWAWDRLRCRYVDSGRTNANELKVLAAAFRGLILDWHEKLEAKGEGDLLYLFHTTQRGDKRERVLEVDGRTLLRDVHGGGYHGGWGSAARMRIYEELLTAGVLTDDEQARFKHIVYQSLDRRIIDFSAKTQTANNHSFGNAGGVALALKLFPDAPQAREAGAWIDRIWQHLADFGDWKEWNYYPYGPIFLHGMLDIAEATGRIETDRVLITSIGRRCLGFVHGGGIRGNPNSGVRMRESLAVVYEHPWQHGYFDIEQSPRDAHFWYRLAQHYEDPEYLWAAEQVALGGRSPDGHVPADYQAAWENRFHWFVERGIEPRVPADRAAVGLLSATRHKVHERIYLHSGRGSGMPFAAFFLYDRKDEHLDNVSGHLYEYSALGAKLLHCSGKYNNVYSGTTLRGGGTGEESLDLLLIMHKRHKFPLHPDRTGDERDFMRRGSIHNRPDLSRAENNDPGDAFGQFGVAHYYGPDSRWIRRTVLTREGYLVVADSYVGGEALQSDYVAGPVWHLAAAGDEPDSVTARQHNWFDAPAFAHAWWQKAPIRVLLVIHGDTEMQFASVRQTHSQDTDPNVTCFGWRPITSGTTQRFLSVLVPYSPEQTAGEVLSSVETDVTESGLSTARIGSVTVKIGADGAWSVSR